MSRLLNAILGSAVHSTRKSRGKNAEKRTKDIDTRDAVQKMKDGVKKIDKLLKDPEKEKEVRKALGLD